MVRMMEEYKIKAGDIITMNGIVKIVGERFDVIVVELPSGNTIIISNSDVNTVCPKIEKPTEDKRRGQ